MQIVRYGRQQVFPLPVWKTSATVACSNPDAGEMRQEPESTGCALSAWKLASVNPVAASMTVHVTPTSTSFPDLDLGALFGALLTFGQELLRMRHDLSSARKSLALERLGVLRHQQVQNRASEFIHPAADCPRLEDRPAQQLVSGPWQSLERKVALRRLRGSFCSDIGPAIGEERESLVNDRGCANQMES